MVNLAKLATRKKPFLVFRDNRFLAVMSSEMIEERKGHVVRDLVLAFHWIRVLHSTDPNERFNPFSLLIGMENDLAHVGLFH